MLHIVNGDTVADKLRQGGVEGDILVWREIYPVGPVFGDMENESNRAARAGYLEQVMGIPQAEYIEICRTQEKKLQDFKKYEEVVLWFEHDLFDQTMLCYLLHWFAKRALGKTKLSLLCIGAYPGIELFRGLGQLTAKQLAALSGTWQLVGRKELELGSKIWGAYSSAEIEDHNGVLRLDTSILPFVRDAFEAHLSRLPSARNGLGIIEQATLETLASGTLKPYELFQKVGNQLNILGTGDLEYWYRLAKMSEEPYPLISIRGPVNFPDFNNPESSFHECAVSLTELGRNVLDEKQDWAALKGPDDWVGGLRLKGKAPFRWDPSDKTAIKVQDEG
ncbi:DUF1835 domain-containing protein [Paenibacillus hamazuiensis]|uniref:DUF1835 domain-containing protein n=1 Tax=Paenibacillus hamazuiensis TaxID=2936508 RepID=UPI00200E0708|nr:DUF1835 domain-containing protein [Paenibacillus hamazuiensis]